jgi:hypothetical protein
MRNYLMNKVISAVKANVPETALDKTKSKLNKLIQKTKGSKAKLKQTLFEIKNKQPLTFKGAKQKTLSNTEKAKIRNEESKKMFEKTMSDNKKVIKNIMRGGKESKKDGGRMGLKRGTGLTKKKSNVQKIKETFAPKNKSTKFGMLSVKAGIDKNPNPTQADRIAGAKMKSKKRFV